MHILKSRLKKPFRNLSEGFEVEYKNITLLVGEQGCGKSSLLALLQRSNQDEIAHTLSEHTLKYGTESFFFDTEKMNPRMVDFNHYDNPDSIGVCTAVQSKFTSHGETLREFTVNRIHQLKNAIMFFDEPESSLSLKNQYKLAAEIEKAVAFNAQFIIATHCLPLIESQEAVYDLEKKEWTLSKDFINNSKINLKNL